MEKPTANCRRPQRQTIALTAGTRRLWMEPRQRAMRLLGQTTPCMPTGRISTTPTARRRPKTRSTRPVRRTAAMMKWCAARCAMRKSAVRQKPSPRWATILNTTRPKPQPARKRAGGPTTPASAATIRPIRRFLPTATPLAQRSGRTRQPRPARRAAATTRSCTARCARWKSAVRQKPSPR